MDKTITFQMFKNIIIEQNKILIKKVAIETGIDEKELLEKYLQPAYYLPIITNTKVPSQNNTT